MPPSSDPGGRITGIQRTCLDRKRPDKAPIADPRRGDAAGLNTANRLRKLGAAAGIDVRELVPIHGDFNFDLCRLGREVMLRHLAAQLVPADLDRCADVEVLRRPA